MSVYLPETPVATVLRDWSNAAEEALALGEHELCARLSQVILRRLPRHLATYRRLILLSGELRRWDEGEDWGRRLLQADPANAIAWRALGRAAEQRDLRTQAHAIYRRAFEIEPYDPQVRAGLSRTGLDEERNPELNMACLGALYLKGRRWGQAISTYNMLAQAEPRRIDFQVLRTYALWQSRAHREAHQLARKLTQEYPNLLMAWIVLDALGNPRERQGAQDALEALDPDGEYMLQVYDLPAPDKQTRLNVTSAEARLLEEFVQAAGFAEEPVAQAADASPTAPADSTEDAGDFDEAGDTEAGNTETPTVV